MSATTNPTAVHEAGHAVAAVLRGLSVKKIRVFKPGEKPGFRGMTYFPEKLPTAHEGIVSFAGPYFETVISRQRENHTVEAMDALVAAAIYRQPADMKRAGTDRDQYRRWAAELAPYAPVVEHLAERITRMGGDRAVTDAAVRAAIAAHRAGYSLAVEI
ncbi:MAG: M50 family metallopeptidase [Nocardiaceae bacterium]|nr:M50 family metallopeptidase [Nocardiaceae bacterium]